MKEEKQTFKFPMTPNKGNEMILEFFVCGTNELNPYRETKELALVLYDKDDKKSNSDEFYQLDNSNQMGIEEIEALIKFLHKAKKHIKTFNANSKPQYFN